MESYNPNSVEQKANFNLRYNNDSAITNPKLNALTNQMRKLSFKIVEEKNNLLNVINKNILTNQESRRSSSVVSNNYKDYNISTIKAANVSSKNINKEKPLIGINPYSNLNSHKTVMTRKKSLDSNSDTENQKKNARKKISTDNLELREIGDELESLRDDLFSQIKKLQKSQGKLSLDSILEEFTEFKSVFKQNMHMSLEMSKNEINHFRENFSILKKDIQSNLNKETISNREILISMSNELKKLQEEMKNRITEIEKKQKLQLEGFKFIIENTSDNRTRFLAEKFLTNNQEEFEKNKFSFIKPAGKELNHAIDEIQQKIIKHNRNKSMLEDEKLLNLLKKTNLKNQHYEEATKIDLVLPQEKNKILSSVNKRFSKYLDQQNEFKMGRINHLRKTVFTIIAYKRLEKINNQAKMKIQLENLNEFTINFTECDNMLKKFIYDSIKNSLLSFLDLDQNVDLTSYNNKIISSTTTGTGKGIKDPEIKGKYTKLEIRLKILFEELNNATTKENIPSRLLNYLRILITNESYIPFKFFSFFELSRLELTKYHGNKNECLITGMKEKYCAMVICFYIIVKIIVKFILIDLNYVSEIEQKKIKKDKNSQAGRNLKIFASIIFCDTKELFKRHCPVINQIKNYEDFCMKQSLLNDNSITKDVFKLNNEKKYEPFFLDSVNRVNQIKSQEYTKIQKKEKELLESFNKKITINLLDKDANSLDYVQNDLYSFNELSTYYIMAKENNFDLTQKIFMWVRKLIKIVKEQ